MIVWSRWPVWSSSALWIVSKNMVFPAYCVSPGRCPPPAGPMSIVGGTRAPQGILGGNLSSLWRCKSSGLILLKPINRPGDEDVYFAR
jgi:hypothetical protein